MKGKVVEGRRGEEKREMGGEGRGGEENLSMMFSELVEII